jgi:hypothetical protein
VKARVQPVTVVVLVLVMVMEAVKPLPPPQLEAL